MKKMSCSAFLALALPFLAAGTCDPTGEDTETKAQLADGTYAVSYAHGYAAADEAKILAIRATLNRAANQLVFTQQDGTTRTLSFTPRPESAWQRDCVTSNSHSLDELADLAPSPLRLESMTFNTPMVFAKCGPQRMIVANSFTEANYDLVMDKQ